jgi:nicotinamide-nucleotide amidase
MKSEILSSCGEMLIAKKLTIAFTESATAGRLAAEFSLIENAGQFLKGGLVCYDAGLKESILKIPHTLIEKYTPESAEVTEAITKGLSEFMDADLHIGVTGLIAPGGSETEEKPVGTIFVHCLCKGQTLFADRRVFDGDPETIVLQSIERTASQLMEHIKAV